MSKVLVSACLLGKNCKYSGGNNHCKKLTAWAADQEVIPVCPEVMGGLPTPRLPCEIVHGIVTDSAGENVDSAFRLGARRVLELAEKEKPDLCILQSRSPSCGVKTIYDGTFTGKIIDGQGVTAKLLIENGFRVMDVEDWSASYRQEEL